MIGFLIGLIIGLLVLIWYLLSAKTMLFKKIPKKAEPVDVKVYTEDFLKDIQEFDDIFGYGTATIEKETYGFTTSWDEWKEKVYTPDNVIPLWDMAKDKGSFALAESIMIDGKVYTMKVSRPIASLDELKKAIDKLFVVWGVLQGVSPIDGKTVRYWVSGSMDDGEVPTFGV